MTDCLFCKIISGEIPSRIMYEDDQVVAFWDAHPTAPTHILIVPRKHVPTLNDLEEGDPILCHMAEVAKKIASNLDAARNGYRFFINVGREGGQVIFHLHAHLMAGNDFGMTIIKFAIAVNILLRKIKKWIFGK
ncbi:MAG: histidine triad nucleotide-binding protein [Thermodesulfobacteriota bacterium]